MKVLRDYLVYLAVRLAICFIQAVRIETCQKLSHVLAWLTYDVVKVRRKVIDDNLFHAFPEKSQAERQRIARATYAHLVLMVCEIAQAPRKIHETNWRDHVYIHQKRKFVEFLLDRRPVVIVSAHYGNFEIAGFMLGLLGVPTFTVARTLDNPFVDKYLNRFREAKGQFIVEKQGSARQIDDVLAQGGKLVLLGDQHAGPKGCWVEFFGRPASCHKAIAVFPLTAGAPLAVGYGRRVGDRPLQFELGMAGYLDPAEEGTELGGVKPVTQWYNRRLEELIRDAPEQYWWVHRRWRDAPKRPVSAALRSEAAKAA
jgi:Kdo2-lipid IVA lauroyltransferase/acyltransferase